MGEIKLTIGIPTWNRSSEIREAIDSILDQLNDTFRPQVEILISDNASTDTTQTVVRDYADRYPKLFSIHRNPVNIGFSRNVDALFRHARGEFVLVLSDDDALEPDALCEIFVTLERHPDVHAMFLSCSAYDGALLPMGALSEWRKADADKTPGASCVYYASGIDYFHARGTLCNTCISGNMFRTSVWLRTDMSAGLVSGSVQLHAGIQILSQGSICVIDKPLVKYRDGGGSPDVYLATRGDGANTGWPFVYFFDMVSACKGGRDLYPRNVYRSFYLTCVRGVFYMLLEVKARNGFINRAWFNARLTECFDAQCYGWFIRVFRVLVSLPSFLFIVPNWMYRFGRKLYYASRSIF